MVTDQFRSRRRREAARPPPAGARGPLHARGGADKAERDGVRLGPGRAAAARPVRVAWPRRFVSRVQPPRRSSRPLRGTGQQRAAHLVLQGLPGAGPQGEVNFLLELVCTI